MDVSLLSHLYLNRGVRKRIIITARDTKSQNSREIVYEKTKFQEREAGKKEKYPTTNPGTPLQEVKVNKGLVTKLKENESSGSFNFL